MLPFPSTETLVHTLSICLKPRSLPLHYPGLHSFIRERCIGMAHRDSACLASLVEGYIQCGNYVLALQLYQKMQQESRHLNAVTLVSLLKACAELKDVKTGSILHVHAAKLRLLESSRYVGAALVDMYAKCGALSEAHKVFDSLRIWSTVIWNALISGYVRHRRFKEAVNLFHYMQTQGFPPDSVTFVCILKACGSLGAADMGLELHDAINRMGLLQMNQFVGNSLVNMYSKCGLHAKAKQVLKELPIRDVVSWNALMTGHMEHNCAEEVLMCYEKMQLEGIPPNDVTYACALQACGSIGARYKGIEIHADIRRRGSLERHVVVGTALVDMYGKCGMLAEAQEAFNKLHAPDVIAWSALIAGYTQHKQAEQALNCFDLMQSQGISPNSFTYSCSLKACGILGAIEKGGKIHDAIEQEGLLKKDEVVGSAVVDMYAKCGSPSKAWEVFEQLPYRDVISWTAIISGYAQLGETANVLKLLERMRGEGINPNQVTFLSALNACSHAGSVDKGQSLFEEMTQEFGIVPALKHLTCGIDLLSRAGQFDKATEIITRTPSHFDTATCHVMLEASKNSGNIALGRDAIDLATRLDERETAAYICMHDIYADSAVYTVKAHQNEGHE